MRGRGRQALVVAVLPAVLGAATVALAQPPSGVVHVPGGSKMSKLRLGAGLFAANCSSCHGPTGEGVARASNRGAGDVAAQGPSLRRVGAAAPDFYLRTGRMPLDHAGEEPERQQPWFNSREIAAITAYVAGFGGGPKIPEPHPDFDAPIEGMALFTEHCAGCHQVVGEGGYVSGAKVPSLLHADATEIAEAVRIGPFLMPEFPRSQISDRDLDKIVAYVLASRHPDDEGGLGIGHLGPVPEGLAAWLVAGFAATGVCVLLGRRLKA